jgi:hypothetical protein
MTPCRSLGAGWSWSMINVLGLTFLTATFTLAAALPTSILRAAVVLPIALFLPGYSLVTAILGPSSDRASSFGAIVVSSIAFYALASLALAALSVRLTASSIAGAVSVFVVAAGATILLRFGSATTVDVRTVLQGSWATAGRFVALVVLGALVVVVTFAARLTFASAPPPPFTQFAFAGSQARLATVVARKSPHLRVELELRNDTQQRQWYRIAPILGDVRWKVREVRLEPGQGWSGTVGGVVPLRSCSQRLVIALETLRPHDRVTQLARQINRRSATCIRPGSQR